MTIECEDCYRRLGPAEEKGPGHILPKTWRCDVCGRMSTGIRRRTDRGTFWHCDGKVTMKALIERCIAHARRSGFRDQNVEGCITDTARMRASMAIFTANLHSEVDELQYAADEGRINASCDKGIALTCGEEELADIMIRLFDTADYLNIDVTKSPWPVYETPTLDSALVMMHGRITLLWECFRKGLAGAEQHIIVLLGVCVGVCITWGVDPARIIEVKCAYNETRGHLHGGKKA